MKRHLLIFSMTVLLVSLGQMLHAQPSSSSSRTPPRYISLHIQDTTNPIGGHTIVRSWGTNSTVTFYVTRDSLPKLEIVDHSTGSTKWVYLPDDLFLKDMYVDQTSNILYFCGSTNYSSYNAGEYSGYGILGYINLRSYSYPNIPVYYIEFDQPGYDLNSINKLVEYDVSGAPQIVAIGEKRNAGRIFYMIDCFNISGSPIRLNVSQFPYNERYDDILRTNRFVVFLGYNADPSVQSLCYRKTNPYGLSDPILNDIHLFNKGDDALSLTHSTAMIQDKVATSYLSINSVGKFVTRIRTIDMSMDQNTHSQDYVIYPYKIEPDGIIYMPEDSSLVLMQRLETEREHRTIFLHLLPYPQSPYNSIMEFKDHEFFESLTPYNTHYYMAAIGGSWFMKNITMHPNNYPDIKCPTEKSIGIERCDNLLPYSFFSPIGFTYYPYSLRFGTCAVNQSGVNVNCSNQY
ncbi:MAG: hypothetical protein K6F72_01565 [Bacteroidales bacterium]|nr:hypothetical protein [Bacteroidales bacterium]